MARAFRTKPRKLPRQTRAKATVDAIIAAAARILAKDGYDRANVNLIAARAGVSVGSLYQYFPSKESLVAAVMKWHFARMNEVFERDLADLAFLPLHEAVRGVAARTLEAYDVDRVLYRVISEEVPRTGLLMRTNEFEDRIREIFLAYFDHHRLCAKNRALVVRILMTAVAAVAADLAIDPKERLDDPKIADELAALVLGYVERER